MKIERLSLRAKPALKDQRTHSPDLPDVLEFQLERLIPRLRLEHQAPRRLKGMSWFACRAHSLSKTLANTAGG